MSSVTIGGNEWGVNYIGIGMSWVNDLTGTVVVTGYRNGTVIFSTDVPKGNSGGTVFTDYGLTCGTQYNYTATLVGKSSGTLYNSWGSSESTAACPAPFFPFFPPFFPPYFPFFPPFFPPYFPFFPPFFPPYFAPNPVWTDSSLANSTATETVSYSDGVSAQYATTYALYDGALPSGININPSTGSLTGTPVDGSAGTYNFRLSASGDGGTIQTSQLTLVVNNDGGKVYVYNSSTSQWEESTVYIYNSATSTWQESEASIYNSSSSTWETTD